MFNDDFYPTPNDLLRKMLSGIELRYINTILEPSAGKGDIVDYINSRLSTNKNYIPDIDCIEIEPELRHILKGKGYKVVHDNFLSYPSYKRYDLIIANPPFSQGAKHLLKMLEMQERGGAIICILNAETLKNPIHNERKALLTKIEDYNASIEYIESAFTSAERKTNVEIALVKVDIPKKEETSFLFEESLKKAEDLRYKDLETEETNYIAKNNFIDSIIDQYRVEVSAGISLIEEYRAMAPHILKEFEHEGSINAKEPIIKLVYGGYNGKDCTINGFVKRVRVKYWRALFNNPKFTSKLTTNLRDEYRNKVEELADYDFSSYNILTVRAEMNTHIVKSVEDTIYALFEDLSHKYSYWDETSKNIHYFNGWKTNKSWFINKKVIIPLSAYDDWWGKFDTTQRRVIDKLSDIEKCFNYLDGGLTEPVDMESVLAKAKEDLQTKKIQLKYFTVTFYKKGTCHIEFTNLELLKKFNIFGSQYKGWLPPSYGKKSYDDMTDEEKAVIDSFEGEKEYSKVYNKPDYYITSTSNLLMLEG